MLRRMSEGKQCLERALAISPDWLPARIGITQFLLFEGKTDEVYQKMGELAEVPGIVQQLISDPLYRFRWEIGLPPVYEQRLEECRSATRAWTAPSSIAPRAGFTRGTVTTGANEHTSIPSSPCSSRGDASRQSRRSRTSTSDLRIPSSVAPRKPAPTRTALERSEA